MTEAAEGAQAFLSSGEDYDRFMGRYATELAKIFADAAGVTPGKRVLDVGCGPGALTTQLVRRVGVNAVSAFDPSPPFVDDCAARHPGLDVQVGRAEAIPFEDGQFDLVLAQLVLQFVSDGPKAAAEMRRVARPGGTIAACVWDFGGGMQMLRAFWDAALAIDPEAPDEARTMRFGRAGEIAELFADAGYRDVRGTTLTVSTAYASFDELWAGFLLGIGPAGAFCVSLPDDRREAMRRDLHRRLGSPAAGLTLTAMAHCAVGRAP